jgi:hypothetical protein
MFWPTFLFVVGVLLPFSSIVSAWPTGTLLRILSVAVSVVLALVAIRLLWLHIAARRRRARLRPPDPKVVASLDWPRLLSRDQMEQYCTEFLRLHNWTVALGRSPLDDGTFVTAAREGTRVVLLCDVQGEELNPATIRGFAQAGPVFSDARPVLVTRLTGRLPHPAEQAARAAGVTILRVADLAQIDALAAAPAAQAPADAAAG